MAASIFRCSRAFIYVPKQTLQSLRCASGEPYYVLLPEIPPDTPETNPVMRLTDQPDFHGITPDNIITGCAKLSIKYETALGSHLETLKDPREPKTFESVYEPIEEIAVPLSYAWRAAKHLNYVDGSPDYRQAFQRVHPQVEKAKNDRWISEVLYNAGKEVIADSANLTEYQRRLTQMYQLEARLNGIRLSGPSRKRFLGTLKKLVTEKNNFRSKVIICQRMFSHRINDFSQISELPRSLVQLLSENRHDPSRGPWKVTLQPEIYYPFLQYCGDRMLRWNAWQAFNNRASIIHNEHSLSNHKIIEQIQLYRRDIAELLGYENFAEMSMETKMAGSVENVMNMIGSLKSQLKPKADQEILQLTDFAHSHGFSHHLQVWDLPYWRRLQKQQIYQLEEAEVAQYFPLNSVLDGLFLTCKQLFGIEIKESTKDVNVWAEGVRFYNIYDDDGTYLSSFFLDPYRRPPEKIGGTWMETGRERSDLMNTKPLSYLVLNLAPPPNRNRQALLTVNEVSRLFHEFGHGLQQLLTRVPYSEISGQRNIEWDALQVVSTFMGRWLFLPQTLRAIGRHHETGQPLPDDLIDKIIKGHEHMCAYDMISQLYLGAYDMEVHVSKDHWNDTMKRLWQDFMPLPLDHEDAHPCSFTHIFSDQYPAAYYSFKWSEMLSADIFSAFVEAGLEQPDKVAAVGRRFRDTFLSLGGGVSAGEVFRRFRGRDPSLDAIQEQFRHNES